ncbi:MAG: hypothetical protein LAT62_08110 [Natronospirillum sp.]|uniref:hypothetical protein n=1 Tax=Natronospirillum sp. TaxID=2812955 RepID=UPI0025E083A1|nr:hypothetical protein [Natronospirillum sp.]MCH8551885.1 hypothetical protein [Natronospirillum sp.]
MKESEIRFFKPLWRRLALLSTALAWVAVELVFGSEIWLLASLCLVAYILWRYLLRFPAEGSDK